MVSTTCVSRTPATPTYSCDSTPRHVPLRSTSHRSLNAWLGKTFGSTDWSPVWLIAAMAASRPFAAELTMPPMASWTSCELVLSSCARGEAPPGPSIDWYARLEA